MGIGVMGRGQRWTRDSCHHSGKAHREGRTKSDNALDVPARILAFWVTARGHCTGPQQTVTLGPQAIRMEPWAQVGVPQRARVLTPCKALGPQR